MEQLQSWAEKLSLPLYKGAPGQDPASVCYEAHAQAIREGCQYLICDTAGRLHTRHNLMEELSKIRRTLAKQDASAPHYTMLVVDAIHRSERPGTGQGIPQGHPSGRRHHH